MTYVPKSVTYVSTGLSLDDSSLKGSAAALGLIPITVPELLRQLRGTVIPEPRRDKAHRGAWALWRRRHQYQAQQAHQRWHAYADELPR